MVYSAFDCSFLRLSMLTSLLCVAFLITTVERYFGNGAYTYFHLKLNENSVVLLNKTQYEIYSNETNMSTPAFIVASSEPLPSRKCFSADIHKHPLEQWLVTPLLQCYDHQFTHISMNGSSRQLDLSQCIDNPPASGGTLTTAKKHVWHNGVRWNRTVFSPKGDGVDIVYTSCGNKTNLRVYPYRLPRLKTSHRSPGRPSVLFFVLESTSTRRFEIDFPLTNKLLGGRNPEYKIYGRSSIRFLYTSVTGHNTEPNIKRMVEGNPRKKSWWKTVWNTLRGVQGQPNNIFHVARKNKMITSVWDDYCPVLGLCNRYPFDEHRVCDNLLCNYGDDIKSLYYRNPVPGCVHGEWWIRQHLRYIDDLWTNVYPNERIFHAGQHYACHMENRHRSVCQSNDKDLRDFLSTFLKRHPETFLILASDHGFHWSRRGSKYNEHAAGESEHRRPLLQFVLPQSSSNHHVQNARLNSGRFVTHDDVHATMNSLFAQITEPCTTGMPCRKQIDSMTGFDLLNTIVPKKRSCNTAKIPNGWCSCLVPADGEACRANSQVGEVCNSKLYKAPRRD